MDDDELGRLIRAADPARTPAGGPLTERELATMHDITAGRSGGAACARLPDRAVRRRRRIGCVVVGATVAIGGVFGGIAVADSLMPHGFRDTWADADYTRAFELPSGRGCEVRVMVVDAEGGRELTGASADVSHWLAGSSLWETLDWGDAQARDARDAERSPGQTALLDENGRLGDQPVSPSARTPDDVYANVVSLAVGVAIDRELDARGIRPGAVHVWDSVRCDTVTG